LRLRCTSRRSGAESSIGSSASSPPNQTNSGNGLKLMSETATTPPSMMAWY
jgi:hypothetical protein